MIPKNKKTIYFQPSLFIKDTALGTRVTEETTLP